jgi:hypothetical protein
VQWSVAYNTCIFLWENITISWMKLIL